MPIGSASNYVNKAGATRSADKPKQRKSIGKYVCVGVGAKFQCFESYTGKIVFTVVFHFVGKLYEKLKTLRNIVVRSKDAIVTNLIRFKLNIKIRIFIP